MKVVYNGCYGGFSLSHKAIMRYAELKGFKLYPFVSRDFRTYEPASESDFSAGRLSMIIYYITSNRESGSYWSDSDISRSDPDLVKVVEELGEAANGHCASLCIDEVPAGEKYRIDEYDGNESVMKQSDYEWEIAT